MELMQASNQWMSRPDDQRFTSLNELLDFTRTQRQNSRSLAVSSRKLSAAPVEGDPTRRSLVVLGPDGTPTVPTHWAFGQLAQRVKAPAGYLRTLPADIVADNLNYGLKTRPIEDVGALLRVNGPVPDLAAMTGPNYGRIWNADVVGALVDRFGDGVTGDFTVPGEFGVALDEVTKRNTTLYASDRDMFVFLADEKNRIEVPGRRNGQTGEMARGFFVWNSEVGDKTLGVATFLFDYVCMNRIVWGAQGYQEIRVRHTISAPDKFIEQVAPAIEAYSNASAAGINEAIENARSKRFDDEEAMIEFLGKRFSVDKAKAFNLSHIAEEGRPIETLWDATVGMTAYAKNLKYQDARVDLEREAGKVMDLAK